MDRPRSNLKSRRERKPRPGPAGGVHYQLILIDGEPVRKKTRREYEQVKRHLEKARREIDQFKTGDRPAFERWLHATFGSRLTDLRDLLREQEEITRLIMEVEQISFLEGISQFEAYRLILHRRAHPEEMEEEPDSTNDGQRPGHDRSAADESDEEAFDEFEGAFDEALGKDLPPEILPPGFGSNPESDPRVKELYRILARKLHPDAQEQMTQQKLEWWHEVQAAYAEGDVGRMELILNLCELQEGSPATHTSVSMLQRIIAQVKASLREAKNELGRCRREPAWNFDRRPDRAALENRVRADLDGELLSLRQQIDALNYLLQLWAREAAQSQSRGPRRRRGKAARKRRNEFLF